MNNPASLSLSPAASSLVRSLALAPEPLAEALTPTELRAYAFTYVFRGLVVLGAAAAVVAAGTQLLLIALAMLVSCVVPGYLLHQRSHKHISVERRASASSA